MIMNKNIRTLFPCVLRISLENYFSCNMNSSQRIFTVPVRRHSMKTRSYLQYLKRKVISPPAPPYSHVCQVGDPVLRCKAVAVDPGIVQGPEIQSVIKKMVTVMRKFHCVGLSAPQVGVPLRIIVMEYSEKMLHENSPAIIQARGLVTVPLKIFVNPELSVLDGQMANFQEACESISGYSASVPRYISVEVSGLNEKAEPVIWKASGWPARILQHEMDHLNGILYVDRMDSKTFLNMKWEQYNE